MRLLVVISMRLQTVL